jgi:hypothetical protein
MQKLGVMIDMSEFCHSWTDRARTQAGHRVSMDSLHGVGADCSDRNTLAQKHSSGEWNAEACTATRLADPGQAGDRLCPRVGAALS